MSARSDFDLGGVVGVRALDAGPREIAGLERQLGVSAAPLPREPDILLRFVPELRPTATLRYVGLEDAAFDDHSFLLLRGKSKSRARVALPFEDVGGRITLTCERGLLQVPLLVSIVNATMLAKAVLPLHAAAFEHAGRGVLVTGWSKGGKTETLLAFAARGARYVADEWLYLDAGGASMFGLGEPLRLWSWHLASLPELRARIGRSQRARLALLDLVDAGLDRLSARAVLGRTRALVRRQTCVDVPPRQLFPEEPRTDTSKVARIRPEIALFVVSHDDPRIVVEPVDAIEVAERMQHSLAEEDQRLVSCYHKFRFAFPWRRNELLERASGLRRRLLHRALRGVRSFEVRHPYPVSLPALYRALAPYCA